MHALTCHTLARIFAVFMPEAQFIAIAPPLAPIPGAKTRVASANSLQTYYDALFATLGPQHWWPSSKSGGPFEVIVGAILTQSTAWTNVEKAIANLRSARMLTPRAIERIPLPRLAQLIRPSGYFRQKAKKLKAFVRFLRNQYSGSLTRMFRTPTAELRQKLLAVYGIGPETADSVLLYAGAHPVFVVDAYTRRILLRHALIREAKSSKVSFRASALPAARRKTGGERGICFSPAAHGTANSLPQPIGTSYEEIRALFESSLPRDPQLFNQFHALLVHVGKHFCRPRDPRCDSCPLRGFLPGGIPA
jgi:endonuclease-3 related protein